MNQSIRAVVLSLVVSVLGSSGWAVDVTWDGGNGLWTDARWNGGQTALMAFGQEDGAENGEQIFIGGGSEVMYKAGPDFVNSDFRLNSSLAPTSATIREGASLELASVDTDPAGLWTEWDGDLTLDNGTLRRTFLPGMTGSTISSGAMMFGSWNSFFQQEINVSITNGGRIENHGMLMFGAWNESGEQLKVTVTVNNGSIDLTGGDTFVLNDTPDQNADLHFYYGTVNFTPFRKNESYVINFTGPGSIKVDHAGIRVHDIGSDYSTWDHEAQTYQQLWDRGVLRANGESGLTGANFATYFTVTNSLGDDDYTLTSLVNTVDGDFNNDGLWDCTDVNALSAAIAGGSMDLSFDMNGDGQITGADITDPGNGWLAVGGAHNPAQTGGRPFLNGDANLSGDVDGSDFGVWNTNKFTASSAWCSGDFNASGGIDGSDFGIWNANKFSSSDGAAAVPEPVIGLGAAVLLLLGCRGRRTPR